MLAIMFKTDMPLDFVSTDGVTYILYRFHKMKLLKYEQLSAEEVGTSRCTCHLQCMLPSPDSCSMMAYPYLSALQHCFLVNNLKFPAFCRHSMHACVIETWAAVCRTCPSLAPYTRNMWRLPRLLCYAGLLCSGGTLEEGY